MTFGKAVKAAFLCGAACFAVFAAATALSVRAPWDDFGRIASASSPARISDRNGIPLEASYTREWNDGDRLPLHAMPPMLTRAFLFSEDRGFYDHGGVDWRARAAALYQNISGGRTIRGASTITEQVVRMIHPRPRSYWSKWLEGIEAVMLETRVDKASILEFYLNQVPFASERRGVVQAARYYFNRDLDTLSLKETLALAVLARAPTAYDLYRAPGRIDPPIDRLANAMADANLFNEAQYADFLSQTIVVSRPSLPVEARHFARFVRLSEPSPNPLRTSLDGTIQTQVQDILDQRLKRLSSKNVANAAALVIDHTNGDILAWVVAGAKDRDTKAGDIDAVLTARQPGSTLKPFLYAAALDKDWTAAQILNDAPVAEAVGKGLHRFRNYSGSYHGFVTVREALGNSLNIPAVLAIRHVGVAPFLSDLHALGFDSLDRGSAIYDEGLALGTGEVTLYELVRAYAALANKGAVPALRYKADALRRAETRVYTDETASIIGDILSDPRARALEFGRDSVLNLPVRTAMKTGTSTDYKDAWTVGYNDRYTVGIWMGNLDRSPMRDVTGSTGPALAARSIFNVLNKNRETKPLYLSPGLFRADTCTRPPDVTGDCPRRTELFARMPGDIPLPSESPLLKLVRPTAGLMIAKDPRIPAERQKFRFELAGLQPGQRASWFLDDTILHEGPEATWLWPVEKGRHALTVTVTGQGKPSRSIGPVPFYVR